MGGCVDWSKISIYLFYNLKGRPKLWLRLQFFGFKPATSRSRSFDAFVKKSRAGFGPALKKYNTFIISVPVIYFMPAMLLASLSGAFLPRRHLEHLVFH
jgi:hypothetical protein